MTYISKFYNMLIKSLSNRRHYQLKSPQVPFTYQSLNLFKSCLVKHG